MGSDDSEESNQYIAIPIYTEPIIQKEEDKFQKDDEDDDSIIVLNVSSHCKYTILGIFIFGMICFVIYVFNHYLETT